MSDFTSEKPIPNIWAIHDEEDKTDGQDDTTDISSSAVVSGDHDEDELEKPSFLRRLGRRKKEDGEDS